MISSNMVWKSLYSPVYSEAILDHIIGLFVRVSAKEIDVLRRWDSAYFSASKYFELRSLCNFLSSSFVCPAFLSKGVIFETIRWNFYYDVSLSLRESRLIPSTFPFSFLPSPPNFDYKNFRFRTSTMLSTSFFTFSSGISAC